MILPLTKAAICKNICALKISYRLNRVAQASIENPVRSRNGHATVAGSDFAIMSLENFFWEGAKKL